MVRTKDSPKTTSTPTNNRVIGGYPIIGPYEGFTEDDLDTDFFKTPAAIDQANIIRGQMGLEPLTTDTAVPIMKAAVIAGAEDLRSAVRFVKQSSDEFNVDPERIALMGFSAGAVTAINVAYGMQEDVAAIIVNSGYPSVFNMERLVTAESDVPPALIFMAQNDYAVVDMELPPFLKRRQMNLRNVLFVESRASFHASKLLHQSTNRCRLQAPWRQHQQAAQHERPVL